MTTVRVGVGRGWSGSATATNEELKDECWKRREGTTDSGLRRGGERAAHHALGMARHSSQPASGHGLAWELRLGSRTRGAENAGLEVGSPAREKGRRPGRKCLSAAGRASAIGTRGTSGSGLAAAAAIGTLSSPLGAAQRPPDSSGCPSPKDRARPRLPRH